MSQRRSFPAGCLAAAAAIVWSAPVSAHPHVLVDAKSEVVFDQAGLITSVRHAWRFDPAFSAFAIQGLDQDGDGQLSKAELTPLAKINVESLDEFDFFTYLAIDDEDLEFTDARDYWLEFDGGQLTLYYDLPLKTPIEVGEDTTLEVFDPEYFVAFTFVPDDPVSLAGAPSGCSAVYYPPKQLDEQTMVMLGAIPQDQRELPDELAGAAADLVNIAKISCT